MPTGMVVLTPGAAYEVAGVPVAAVGEGLAIDSPDWVPRVALDITASVSGATSVSGAGPLLLVFTGAACTRAPYVGFAQRAARRAVSGYVLVDPILPAPGAVTDWPDAPVTVVLTADADADTRSAGLGARLRGWDVVEGEPASIIAEIAQRP